MPWVDVSQVTELPVNGMKLFSVEGRDVLIVNCKGKYFAMDNLCPHGIGTLSDGTLKGNIVTCPVHGSKFDVVTGMGVSGPRFGRFTGKVRDLEVYETSIDGDTLKIYLD